LFNPIETKYDVESLSKIETNTGKEETKKEREFRNLYETGFQDDFEKLSENHENNEHMRMKSSKKEKETKVLDKINQLEDLST